MNNSTATTSIGGMGSMPSSSSSSSSAANASPSEPTRSGPTSMEADLDEKIFQLPLTEAKQAFEKIYLESLLNDTGGNISETSKRAGRYRADIYRLLERYDLHVDEFR
ncbi:MAG: hypothetical protein EOP10_29350 [Proteobacteria bacterium]|nr:MAG: hypothetical protein EOP10_29350 [Pseudomonadota bacterium]